MVIIILLLLSMIHVSQSTLVSNTRIKQLTLPPTIGWRAPYLTFILHFNIRSGLVGYIMKYW